MVSIPPGIKAGAKKLKPYAAAKAEGGTRGMVRYAAFKAASPMLRMLPFVGRFLPIAGAGAAGGKRGMARYAGYKLGKKYGKKLALKALLGVPSSALIVVFLVGLIFFVVDQIEKADAASCTAGAEASPMTSSQAEYVRTTIGVAKTLGIPQRGWEIAIAVMLQESGIRNLANKKNAESQALPNDGEGNDHDSVGLFQQRPAAGWGTTRQLMTPKYAALAFFDGPCGENGRRGLLNIGFGDTPRDRVGWESMSLVRAAQAVQVSCCPEAYGRHETEAKRLAAEHADAPAVPVEDVCPRIAKKYSYDQNKTDTVRGVVVNDGKSSTQMPLADGSWTMAKEFGGPLPGEALHLGADLAAPVGTPVRSTTSGVVTFSGTDPAYGNAVLIEPKGGTVIAYYHLEKPSPLKAGAMVAAGEVIGAVGRSGTKRHTALPHLHVEVREKVTARTSFTDGQATDPVEWLKENGGVAETDATTGGCVIPAVGDCPTYAKSTGGNKAWDGHANGEIPHTALRVMTYLGTKPENVVDATYLRCDAAAMIDQMAAAYKEETGEKLVFSTGYRSLQRQRELWRGGTNGKAAQPGTSNHGWAMAVDFTDPDTPGQGTLDYSDAQYAWMIENGGRFGWINPGWAQSNGSNPEPWHWEFTPLAERPAEA